MKFYIAFAFLLNAYVSVHAMEIEAIKINWKSTLESIRRLNEGIPLMLYDQNLPGRSTLVREFIELKHTQIPPLRFITAEHIHESIEALQSHLNKYQELVAKIQHAQTQKVKQDEVQS